MTIFLLSYNINLHELPGWYQFHLQNEFLSRSGNNEDRVKAYEETYIAYIHRRFHDPADIFLLHVGGSLHEASEKVVRSAIVAMARNWRRRAREFSKIEDAEI